MEQLPIEVRHLFQQLLESLIVTDVSLGELSIFKRDRDLDGLTGADGDAEVHERPVPLALLTVASRLSAAHISLAQRSPQHFRHVWYAGDGTIPSFQQLVCRAIVCHRLTIR